MRLSVETSVDLIEQPDGAVDPGASGRAAVQAIVGAREAHERLATRLLSDEESRRTFLEVVYELLTSEKSASLIQATRNRDAP